MGEEQKKCDKCKRFLRLDGGCTHCERSSLLNGPLKTVSHAEAKKILSEPVVVQEHGHTVTFTAEKLIGENAHIRADKTKANFRRREKNLLYAIDAVRNGDVRMTYKTGSDGISHRRYKYMKTYKDERGTPFTILVLADEKRQVREVFDIYDDK